MKRTALLTAAASAAILIGMAGCASPSGSSGSAYLLSVVPSAISVQMPTSLVQSGTTAKALALGMGANGQMGGAMMGQGPMGGGHFTFDGLGMSGYHWIKQGIWDVQKRLARAAWNMVLVDSVVSGQSLSPSSTTITGSTVTWTQAMVDAYKAMIPSSFASDSAFENAARLPTAGQTSKLPDFVYQLVPSTDTTNYPTYYYQVTFNPINDGETDGETETKTLYWSQDKSQFKFAQQQTDTSITPATITEQNFVAYDGATSTMAAGRIDEDGTMQIQLKADSASTKNGVFITFDASIKAGDGESAFSQSGATLISAQGYADSSGGTVTETITITNASTGAVTVLYLKEGFASTGQLTSAQSSTDGTTWTSIFSTTGSATTTNNYDGMVGAVLHQDFGGMGNEINAEFRHHEGSMGSGSGTTPPTVLEVTPVSSAATISAGPWIASSDSTFSTTTIIGMGFAREAGELKIAFTTVPATGATFYIAPVTDASTTPPTLGGAIQAILK